MRLRSMSSGKETSRSPIRKLQCEIIMLDPTEANYVTEVESNNLGWLLFDNVCLKLGGVLEKEYLGLRYLDKNDQRQWLEMHKSISKQTRDMRPANNRYIFSLRFKHYPRDFMVDLKQDLSRYLLYLQLRRDLYRGRLVGKTQQQNKLAALVLQAETGDIDICPNNVVAQDTNFIKQLKILPHTTKKSESRINLLHEELKEAGVTGQEAERLFIEECSNLETYGVEPITVKDQKGNDLFVGVTNDGISTFNGTTRTHTFPWRNIIKISYSHKLFMFHVVMDQKKHILGFKCLTSSAACALWKWALDRKHFFTLEKASDAKRSRSGGSIFHKRTKYTFSGRSHKELTQSCQSLQIIPQPQVSRAQSMMTLMRSISSRADQSNSSECTDKNYNTLPRLRNKISSFSESGDEIINNRLHPCDQGKSSGVGGVMKEFMQVLRDSPLMRRVSKDKVEDDTKLVDAHHGLDKDDNDDEAGDGSDADEILSDMVEFVVKQRASLKMTDKIIGNVNESNPSDTGVTISFQNSNCTDPTTTTSDLALVTSSKHQPVKFFSLLVLLVFLFLVVMIGATTILYIHNKQLHDMDTQNTPTVQTVTNKYIADYMSIFDWVKSKFYTNN